MLAPRIHDDRLEAGCDEVGRGCLAGPVVAASVILPADFCHPDVIDSKMLSEKKRLAAVDEIKSHALAWAVSFVEPVIIDRVNILNASFLAMTRAVERLSIQPEHLLIDGNRFRSDLDIGYTCMIKGDQKNASIAAASILAKTYRDAYMKAIHDAHPNFGWDKNVGYPTAQHRKALLTWGPTSFHRKSFRLIPEQLRLDLAD
ncbi:MAG: ribonuclease HII [Cryomorphaceae bacterium]